MDFIRFMIFFIRSRIAYRHRSRRPFVIDNIILFRHTIIIYSMNIIHRQYRINIGVI